MHESIEREARGVVATCLGYQTRKLARAVTRLYNDRLRPLGLNLTEMNLLAAIAAQGAVQPARLGRAMALEKSTLSRNSSRLVERGWVEVRDHPDGRGVLLTLTARGNKMLLRAVPAWKQAQQQAQSLVAVALADLEAGKEAS
ncbi:MAG TPA: MarR family transcriptional regulator [Actinomycetes bacterium]|nr:MarR family transcriptional regulator [Actinomycetes bacterium]